MAKSLDLTREKLGQKLLRFSIRLKRGLLIQRPSASPGALSAVRGLRAQALGEKKLKFFPYPIPYEKGERPYAIPDLSGG